VSILSFIKPDCLQEAQNFLEKCLVNDCPSSEFTNSVLQVAQYKGETLASVKEKLAVVSDSLITLANIRRQIIVQASQIQRFSDKPLGDTKDSNLKQELLEFYCQGLFQKIGEQNIFLGNLINLYWDYIPEEVQKILFAQFEGELALEQKIASGELPDSFDASYKEALSFLKNSVFSAIKSDNVSHLKPKVRLPEEELRFLTDISKKSVNSADILSESSPKTLNKSYTLEELLEEISPDSQNEVIDCGEPVGNEVW
jgi:hypothetical protein